MNNSHLFIDLGNSAIKWRFNDKYYSSSLKEFDINTLPKASQIWVSSVADNALLHGLPNVIFIKSQLSFAGFTSAYKSPKTLGVDRFLAMFGGVSEYPNQNLLIIDAGSALTFDLVQANGKHQGGLIAPGLGKLRTSFEKFSSNSLHITLTKLASNTQNAWEFGTAEMLMNMVDTQIERHQNNFADLKVILIGGDAKMIALRLNRLVEIRPNLVLDSLALYVQTSAN